ncbi:MAG: M28 family peptidase [Candidatus Lokiarchaeota archaeon]|nr:M28 family peptidase [Candidatus Lokiarchaeota archaeon]
MKVDEALVDYAASYIKDVIVKFGPRYGCSKAERDANVWTKDEILAKFCDETHFEEFQTEVELYPQGFFKICGLLGVIALVFMPMNYGLAIASTILIILTIVVLYTELFLMKRWIAFMFRKGTSSNAWGVVKPAGEVKFRVVLEGHIDSAKQMHLAEKDKLTLWPLILGFLYLFFTIVMSVIKFLGSVVPGDFINTQATWGPFLWSEFDWYYFIPAGVLFPCFLYLVWGFTGGSVVPGASDNLSGIAVSAAVGKYFSDPSHKLKHVELIIGSMGSEESGDRGARYFVSQHGDLLKNAYAHCIEEASGGTSFNIIDKDFHTFGKLYSPEVRDRMDKAAERYAKDNPDAYKVGHRSLPLGSSDACMYLNAGYKAGWIVSMIEKETPGGKKKGIAKPANWHSMRDNWDRTNKHTLRDCIGMTIEFCKIVDEEQSK